MNRAEIIHENFKRRVLDADFPLGDACSNTDSSNKPGLTPQQTGLANWQLVDLFESQVMSRHLDLVSRKLRSRDEAYYTIGSSGHEGNAVFGLVFRTTDMAFLHYRSCAFLIQRSKQLPGETPLFDMLLSFAASSADPISGGRHKVLGSKSLLVPPQTSTIASHLPKSVGAAHAIGLAARLNKTEQPITEACMPDDSVIVCNFGDASANHSTALGAINAASWASFQNSPMPIVFICEDNGIGISTRTPAGWIQANFQDRAGLKYFYCNGLDLVDTYHTAVEAANYARKHRKAVFLHCKTIRLMGHAGSDAEVSYRSLGEIEAIEAEDPLLHSARILIENRILSPEQVCDIYNETEARVDRVAERAITYPKLHTAAEVMASIIPFETVPSKAVPPKAIPTEEKRQQMFLKEKKQLIKPQHMARLINLALADIMLQYPQTVVFGEDVGRKGGVYGVTPGLLQKFGPSRVIDTLLDEQSILGLSIGLAHNGFIPIPEIQFLAYVHNAEDQIRGEAATLSFFSDSQFTNPMVIRIAGLAYQKGFGGHFHNDNSFNLFRDIPGLILACPSNGRDAVQMLRQCVAMAHEEKRVIVFLEPIALYMTRDLYEPDDGLWASVYQSPDAEPENAISDKADAMAYAEPGVSGDGTDLCILTYANGYYLSRKAARILEKEKKLGVKVVDLRWLVPLNTTRIIEEVNTCKHTLIVDECRHSGSISEALMTLLVEEHVTTTFSRITAEDSFIPLAEAANLVLPDVNAIVEAALSLVGPGRQDGEQSGKIA